MEPRSRLNQYGSATTSSLAMVSSMSFVLSILNVGVDEQLVRLLGWLIKSVLITWTVEEP
jgi:hypothetical protein